MTSGTLQAHQAPLILWDLGGQAGLRSIWDKYYAESHAILYVVDSGTAPTLDMQSLCKVVTRSAEHVILVSRGEACGMPGLS